MTQENQDPNNPGSTVRTSTIRVLVVDDEDLARARICRLLEQSPEAPRLVVRESRSAAEALNLCAEWKPDILFLDMEMPEMSGTDLLHHLDTQDLVVIFQTAHESYALRAFEHAALDFLLKPYSNERFAESLGRALARLQERSPSPKASTPGDPDMSAFLRTFVVRVGERNRILAEDEVLSFTSEDHVTMLCTATISYAYQHSLSYLEANLDPKKFIRIHKSRIVRIDQISSYTTTRPMTVTTKTGEVFRVSREREKTLREVLARHQ
jgi:two-component system LytT family response regulator